jgi:hypothetical protein
MNLAMNPMQPSPRSNLTEMYPGIYQPGHGDNCNDGPNLPTAPLNTVGADPNLSHLADRILSQGWKPTLSWSAVDKCRS